MYCLFIDTVEGILCALFIKGDLMVRDAIVQQKREKGISVSKSYILETSSMWGKIPGYRAHYSDCRLQESWKIRVLFSPSDREGLCLLEFR